MVVRQHPVRHGEGRDPGEVGVEPVAGDGAALNSEAGRFEDQDPREDVVAHGQPAQPVVIRAADENTEAELLDRPTHDGHVAMAGKVVDSQVARLVLARIDEGAIPIDGVPVQVEGDVVGSDDDPVAGAVDEIGVQRRVGGDGVAAGRSGLCDRRSPTTTYANWESARMVNRTNARLMTSPSIWDDKHASQGCSIFNSPNGPPSGPSLFPLIGASAHAESSVHLRLVAV